jgi:hypothetical protein
LESRIRRSIWPERRSASAFRRLASSIRLRPDGRQLAPVMPWQSYAALTDADGHALVAYLKSLPPIRNPVPQVVGPTEKPVTPYLTVSMP